MQNDKLWQLVEKLQANQVLADQKLVSQQEQLSSQQEQLTSANAERQALQHRIEEANNAAVTARKV